MKGLQILTRYKQIDRRLAKLEQILDKRTQCAEPALYVQVELEAQREFPPEDLPLLRSAKAARREGRFHSLEEHAVMERFSRLRDVGARRYGFCSYIWAVHKNIDTRPNSKLNRQQVGRWYGIRENPELGEGQL